MLRNYIKNIPDFPIKGINFKDISPLIANHWSSVLSDMSALISKKSVQADYFIGVESPGFLFASGLAAHCNKGVIMCRKPGKLPPPYVNQSYITEYSKDELYIKEGSGKVIIVDDVLATGGTIQATNKLCKKAGYEVIDNIVLIDLLSVPRVEDFDIKVKSLIQYE